jgi:flavin-dependent dehydrogenase
MSAKQRIVVVGGGIAGHKIAYAMQHVADVTLVDPKDYVEVPNRGAEASGAKALDRCRYR